MTTCVPIFLALTIYVARMLEVAAKREVVSGTIQEKLTFRLFMASGLLLIVGGIIEHVVKGFPVNWLLIVPGIVLAIGSFVLRRATIAALGRFWSLHIEMRDGHKFVQSGPFKWMRHPTYFSMILELVAVILILQAFWSGVAAFLIFIPALFRRVVAEEAALTDKFGDQYRDYQRTTPILFPFKIP